MAKTPRQSKQALKVSQAQQGHKKDKKKQRKKR